MKKALLFLLLTLAFSPAASAEWNYWHAPEVFVSQSEGKDVYMAQVGPKPVRGTQSEMECQVLAFYKNDRPLKTYSRYDIVKISPSLDAPKEHYEILGQAHGFRKLPNGRLIFEVENFKGDVLAFDAETGGVIKT